MRKCIIEQSDIFGTKLVDDISCIDFSDEPQCNNCKGDSIGEISFTPTEESYNNYIRFHGKLVRINILKENKND